MENSLKTVLTALEDLFSKFNNKFYGDQLQTPVITIHPDMAGGSFGWCTTWKAWKDSDKEKHDEGYYEINICAEYLNRPLTDVCATLLHEMVHLWNLQLEVQDCSRGGTYHNKRFKEAAEQHGLLIDKHEKYGWTITKLNQEAEQFISTLDGSCFQLHRTKIPEAMKKAKKGSSSRKYVCPECGMIVRATKKVHVLCGDCDIELEPA